MENNEFELNLIKKVIGCYLFIKGNEDITRDEKSVFTFLYSLAILDKSNFLVSDIETFLSMLSLVIKGNIISKENEYDFVSLINKDTNSEYIDVYLVCVSLLISLEYKETKSVHKAIKNQYLNSVYVFKTIKSVLENENLNEIEFEVNTYLANSIIREIPELVDIVYTSIDTIK